MTVRVGINGFGRIGRNFWRAAPPAARTSRSSRSTTSPSTKTLAHLLKYDSILGRLPQDVEADRRRASWSTARRSRCFAERDPANLPWKDLGVDVVVESTGLFTNAATPASTSTPAAPRRSSSPRRPSGEDMTIVMGVNDELVRPAQQTIISNASCTTNCLAPLAKVLHDAFGIERGLMTTIHAYTADQNLLDGPHKDLRRARAAALNMVPTSTGAAKAIGLVLPELKGKLDGFAMRVPVPTGSVTDLTVQRRREATVEEVNAAYCKAAAEGPLKGSPGLHRGPDRLLRHRHRPGLLHLRRRPDQGDRQPGQGRRLVRQRVGLLQPAGRPGHAGGLEALTTALCGRPPRRGRVGPARAAPRRPERAAGQDHRRDHRRRTDPRQRAHDPGPQGRRRAGVVAAHLGRPKGAPDQKYSLGRWPSGWVSCSARRCLAADIAGDGAKAAVEGAGRRRRGAAGERPVRSRGDQQGRRRAGRARRPVGRARGPRTWTTPSARCTGSTPSVYASPRGCRRRRAAAAAGARGPPGSPPTPTGRTWSSSADPRSPTSSGSSRPCSPRWTACWSAAGCASPSSPPGPRGGDSLLEADQVDTCRRLLASGRRPDRPAGRRGRASGSARTPRSGGHGRANPRRRKGVDVGPSTVEVFGGRAGRRPHRVLERADGRLRGGALRRPARGVWRRRSPPGRPLRSSAAGTPPPRSPARAGRGRIRPHQHRRRRLAGVPRGPGAPRPPVLSD